MLTKKNERRAPCLVDDDHRRTGRLERVLKRAWSREVRRQD